MKLKDAFDYILEQDNTLRHFNAYMIGVTYKENGSFLFVNLSIDDEEIANNVIDYHVYSISGKIQSLEGEEDFYMVRALKTCLINCL